MAGPTPPASDASVEAGRAPGGARGGKTPGSAVPSCRIREHGPYLRVGAFFLEVCIPLRRGDGESVRAMMSSCRHALRHGLSVMIFPEGTRSRDGAVSAFKDGAFRVAVETGVPILPIAIGGTHRCMPKGSRWFGRARAVARILEPIDTRGLGVADVPHLRDTAHARISTNVADLEAALAREGTELPESSSHAERFVAPLRALAPAD